MKHLKILALSAVAAAALMATAGAGTALANTTVLCTGSPPGTVKSEKCPSGAHEYTWPAGEAIHATATNPKLTTSLVNVVCATSESTATPEVDHSEGAITGTVTVSFSECKTEGGTKCEVTVLKPLTGHLEGTIGGNTNIFNLVVTGSEVNVHCGAFINCTYGQEKVTLEGVNGEPTVLNTNNLSIGKVGGTFCPETSNWSAVYKATDTITVH